jgi:hypothetical protein
MPASSFRSPWRLQAIPATENAERRRRSCRNSEIAYQGLGCAPAVTPFAPAICEQP